MTGNAGKLAVITGAAGGMGMALARLMAAEARPLLLCDLDPARIQAVADELRGSNIVEAFSGDIADLDYPARLARAIGERDIGAFIHTAGLSPTMAGADRILKVNFDATLNLLDVVRPRMGDGACAVLIASSAGYMVRSEELDSALAEAIAARSSTSLAALLPRPESAYAGSKRGIIKLVAAEAAAFGARGARIVSISPGLIDTAMTGSERTVSTQMGQMLERTPLRRLGTAGEIASTALFLCSDAASYITGSDIRVDGGTLAAYGF